VWLSVTLALRLAPGVTKRSLMITAGVVLAALVGLTRVYLRVHWLSDVTSGWALGLSCFSAAAIVALITSYIRHNPRRHERAPQLDPGAGAGAGH
jgi:undecaprenyl-diphosphatase